MKKDKCLNMMNCFRNYLLREERSRATVEKYLRDVRAFYAFTGGREVTREAVLEYKSELLKKYAVTSANSMLAAINSFFRSIGRYELCVKQYRIQRKAFCSEERELTRAEYERLVGEARARGNERLSLMLQTICGSGIRVSELSYITVEAARRGEVYVSCKGKNRRIFIVSELRRRLLSYARERGIERGAIFVTGGGRPISRQNIWREMKSLCKGAGVSSAKVFPHNLRHLFARSFYSVDKDIAKLADILGHSSVDTTRIYIVTTGAEHRRRMENMRLII